MSTIDETNYQTSVMSRLDIQQNTIFGKGIFIEEEKRETTG